MARANLAVLLAAGALLSGMFPSHAAESIRSEIQLVAGAGMVTDLSAELKRAYTSNPEVADPIAATGRELIINAKSPGIATIIIWLSNGDRITLPVLVTPDLSPLRNLLHEAFPAEPILVQGLRDAIVLSGRVSSPQVAERALALAAPSSKTVVNNLEVLPPRGARQIVLRVMFAELDRTALEQFGVNLLSTGAGNTPGSISTGQFPTASFGTLKGTIGGPLKGASTSMSIADALNVFAFRPDLNLAAAIQALESKGLLQVLAEPNLVALDGKEASFTVGGEFPVPILQSGATPGAVTVQFHPFGIQLNFLPNVMPSGAIRMHVRPEVSTLDSANGVQVSGFNIPALATRRMETDVELREGQSFVIAGLIDSRLDETIERIPGLASIPILGQLFQSRSRTKSKTELVVTVTPQIRYSLDTAPTSGAPHFPESFLPSSQGTDQSANAQPKRR